MPDGNATHTLGLNGNDGDDNSKDNTKTLQLPNRHLQLMHEVGVTDHLYHLGLQRNLGRRVKNQTVRILQKMVRQQSLRFGQLIEAFQNAFGKPGGLLIRMVHV